MGQRLPPPGSPDNTGSEAPALPARYRFEEALGEGGLGTVVKAYDTQLHSHVAIKTIRHGLARTDPQRYEYFRARFEREAIAGAGRPLLPLCRHRLRSTRRPGRRSLPHPRVCPRWHLARPAYRRPVASGRRPSPHRRCRAWPHGLHEADLVHRDIKPENIFIAADGRAQVGDLGIVQMSTTTFRTRLEYGSPQGHPGTPLYMSPEQASTTDALTPEADQFSLGAVLFESATGQAI